jgi:hypothetical protein
LRKRYVFGAFVLIAVVIWGVYSISNPPAATNYTTSPISSTQLLEACPKLNDPRMNWMTNLDVKPTTSGYIFVANFTYTNNMDSPFVVTGMSLRIINITSPNGTVTIETVSTTTSLNNRIDVGQTHFETFAILFSGKVIAINAVAELDVQGCPPVIIPVNFHRAS